jgi:RNA polymerase sigma-70 factor (ECF subfamily)
MAGLRIVLVWVYRGDLPEGRRRFGIRYGHQVISLLDSHGDRLYRLLVRLTLREDVADDLFQDLVVKLAQARGFAAADNSYAYARTAAVNLVFNWIRSRRRVQPIKGVDRPADDPPAWSQLVDAEEIQRMLDHIRDLRERDRLILVMRYFDEASYLEISQVIGGTPHGARSRCHRAIKRLRVAMGADERSSPGTRSEVRS